MFPMKAAKGDFVGLYIVLFFVSFCFVCALSCSPRGMRHHGSARCFNPTLQVSTAVAHPIATSICTADYVLVVVCIIV